MKNLWEELPIAKIRPETMEDFLSEFCLTSSGDVVHENFAITFKYDRVNSKGTIKTKYHSGTISWHQVRTACRRSTDSRTRQKKASSW